MDEVYKAVPSIVIFLKIFLFLNTFEYPDLSETFRIIKEGYKEVTNKFRLACGF
mgnify:CR=1 FL=1